MNDNIVIPENFGCITLSKTCKFMIFTIFFIIVAYLLQALTK